MDFLHFPAKNSLGVWKKPEKQLHDPASKSLDRWAEPTSFIPGSKCHHCRSNESTMNFGKWRFWTWNEKLIIMLLGCCKDVHVDVHVLSCSHTIFFRWHVYCLYNVIVWYYSSMYIARDLGWDMIQPLFIVPISACKLPPGASESFQRGGLVSAGTSSD